jgi:shikimate dehydrogenase
VRAAVLGRPIGHSLSPRLHRAAYGALGLDWSYDAVELGPEQLPGFLDGLGGEWAGLSLTMPLKQAVLPLLDEVSPLASAVAAANTVVLRDGARSGHNTDVQGIVAALQEAGVREVRRGAVLGAGATAASALAALAELGERRPVVLVRDRSRAAAVTGAAERLGCAPEVVDLDTGSLPEECDAVVSTAPAGGLDGRAERLAARVGTGCSLLDAVYDPWPTVLAERFAARGCQVVSGHVMLLHQAARQVELMTGRPAPLAAMRAALPAA